MSLWTHCWGPFEALEGPTQVRACGFFGCGVDPSEFGVVSHVGPAQFREAVCRSGEAPGPEKVTPLPSGSSQPMVGALVKDGHLTDLFFECLLCTRLSAMWS